ncbi:hypothetical protein C8Q75DRAFT_748025 [Abortiporus biennis]|nr:hypothetical protein C8Q75DRAFT_748025 [Abortiporus biennis]
MEAAPNTTSPSQHPAGAGHVNPGKLVLWIDVFLLSVLGIFTLSALPFLWDRFFGYRDEWKKGHVLYKSDSVTTNQDHEIGLTLHRRSRHPFLRSSVYHQYRHLRGLTIVPGITTGRATLMFCYFGLLLFAASYRDSVFTNPVRQAYVAISQLPVVYVLATKNNAVGILVGTGYEKLNYLHRLAGRLVVLAANVHAIGFIYKWTLQGIWTQRTKLTYVRWGLVALVAFDIQFFFSLSIFRRRMYNFFLLTHYIGLITVLIAVSFHQEASRPYTIIASSLIGVDWILRLLKTRICTAHIEAIPELNSTLIRVINPNLNSGWRAGQHVRLRILSGKKMSWFDVIEAHPYTIASAPQGFGCHPSQLPPQNDSGVSGSRDSGPSNNRAGSGDDSETSSIPINRDVRATGGELVLLVKKTGNWSGKLFDSARDGYTKDTNSPYSHGSGANIKVLIEGPYGGACNTVMSSYSGAFFIVCGSGITFALSSIEELLLRKSQDGNAVGVIELVWCIQQARSISPMLPVFTSFLNHANSSGAKRDIKLRISVFYTRSPSEEDIQVLKQLNSLPRFYSDDAPESEESESSFASSPQRASSPLIQEVPRDTQNVPFDSKPSNPIPQYPPMGLAIQSGRPILPIMLNEFIAMVSESFHPGSRDPENASSPRTETAHGIVIGVCGPSGLDQDVRRAVYDHVNEDDRRKVGGIEIMEE